MVLCAGLGTRLGDLGGERPKPILPVVDIPILRYGLELLAAHGFYEVCINLHHHGHMIKSALQGAGTPLGMEITWSEEPEILGTGGGLKKMADWLTVGGREPFLVVNGKLILDPDLSLLIELHR